MEARISSFVVTMMGNEGTAGQGKAYYPTGKGGVRWCFLRIRSS
jgi:hypothetical protein